ncbi:MULTISPECIES: SDR family oxidoreductase [Burkholderia]|uniref:SDR family oxidoreductase n=1 Tax=Burkholderia TaxID=32008 RepID=UPI00050F6B63|nr:MULTISPECIES: SDR family oxidoreductase [Burkholderia]AYQ86178.1 SDR family oxidoreductase [Burkholderia gladioli]KGE07149.1 serralysin [Burkholderia gladioli]NBI45686.1 SDR family oxidoreductase [Burkholderia sp. ISTR5]
MHDRHTALVTGANKGIGREIVRQLARRGYTVWMGCRDAQRGEQAVQELKQAGMDVHLLEIDVADDESVARAARALAGQTDHLDALVNNAGILGPRAHALEESTTQMLATYQVNVFGAVRVTQAFLGLLKAARCARIVNVSSGLGSLTLTSDFTSRYSGFNHLGYNSSKAALNGVTVSLANALREFGIKVNSADPGYVATDFNDHAGPRTVEQGATPAVRLATLDEDGPTGRFFDEYGPQAW